MRHIITIGVIGFALIALGACSPESDEAETAEDHVWKGQVEAIDKAREVETILKRKHQSQEQQ
jgi:hypothetical protein